MTNNLDGSELLRKEMLLNVHKYITPEPRIHYLTHAFTVPEYASKISLVLSFQKALLAHLFLSLHAPNGFRGNRMNPGAKGDVRLELWTATEDASVGALPGEILPGTWIAQIDIERLGQAVEYQLQAFAEFGPVNAPAALNYPENVIVKPEAGWYKGELHCHSTESDGKFPVDAVVRAASELGLDFLSLTDHFTVSQWRKMAPLAHELPIALIRSSEITSHQGHANTQGIREWVDVYVDRPDWSMRQAAQSTRDQGGLFCVNHPYSGDLSWRPDDFDWDQADLMEIFHSLEGANNHLHAPLWDHHLNLGRRIVGVGGTDSHHPYEGLHRLGDMVTWVYSDNLSEQGILNGLKRGQVYVSRGPQLRFTAVSHNGQKAEMWETLPLDHQPVTFTLEAMLDRPVRVFVTKNGYYFHSFVLDAVPGEWQFASFVDQPKTPSFYRLELHDIVRNEQFPGILWRDYSTTLALTNPIWVGDYPKTK